MLYMSNNYILLCMLVEGEMLGEVTFKTLGGLKTVFRLLAINALEPLTVRT